jgi:hypothetical protein
VIPGCDLAERSLAEELRLDVLDARQARERAERPERGDDAALPGIFSTRKPAPSRSPDRAAASTPGAKRTKTRPVGTTSSPSGAA